MVNKKLKVSYLSATANGQRRITISELCCPEAESNRRHEDFQ